VSALQRAGGTARVANLAEQVANVRRHGTAAHLGGETAGTLLDLGLEPRELGRGAALRFVGVKVREVRAEARDEERLPLPLLLGARPDAGECLRYHANRNAAGVPRCEARGGIVVEGIAGDVGVPL
jgi:hypothetical protein